MDLSLVKNVLKNKKVDIIAHPINHIEAHVLSHITKSDITVFIGREESKLHEVIGESYIITKLNRDCDLFFGFYIPFKAKSIIIYNMGHEVCESSCMQNENNMVLFDSPLYLHGYTDYEIKIILTERMRKKFPSPGEGLQLLYKIDIIKGFVHDNRENLIEEYMKPRCIMDKIGLSVMIKDKTEQFYYDDSNAGIPKFPNNSILLEPEIKRSSGGNKIEWIGTHRFLGLYAKKRLNIFLTCNERILYRGRELQQRNGLCLFDNPFIPSASISLTWEGDEKLYFVVDLENINKNTKNLEDMRYFMETFNIIMSDGWLGLEYL